MNDYVQWDQDILNTAKQQTKDELRQEIARHTEEFLARGGKIQKIPYNWAAEMEARVGYWSAMGADLLDTEDSDDGNDIYS